MNRHEDVAASVPYVAVRWPANHIVMRLEIDGADLDELRFAVTESIRFALDAIPGVAIVEEAESDA